MAICDSRKCVPESEQVFGHVEHMQQLWAAIYRWVDHSWGGGYAVVSGGLVTGLAGIW